jgi:hypothetical protein
MAFLIIGTLAASALIIINSNAITSYLEKVFIIQKTHYALTDIRTEDEVIITYNDQDLFLNLSTDNNELVITITDSNNNNVPYIIKDETKEFVITDKRFSNIKVSPVIYNNLLCLNVNIEGFDWKFTSQTEDGSYYYINYYGKLDKIITARSSIFTGYESYASHRGYIWSRTVPLLFHNFIIGSGADTFCIEFPQQDYVNLHNNGFSAQILTKPHNLYLQFGVQFGVIALAAYLLFYGLYVFSSVKLYISGNFKNFYSQIGASIFVGSIAYSITSISNDSNISVSPVYWVMLGIGVTINYKLLNPHSI